MENNFSKVFPLKNNINILKIKFKNLSKYKKTREREQNFKKLFFILKNSKK